MVAIRTTPLIPAPGLGPGVALKLENLQVTGSFKLRGAFNMIASLPDDQRSRGVITYSSGNHAQAVAYAARTLGVPAVVVMPTTAPSVKVAGARGYGAEVIEEGTTSVERKQRAEREAERRGLTIVPPFDDLRIIAGQGTVGREILEDLPGVERVVAPVGGGGLISGVSAAVRQGASSPDQVSVVGVEPVGAAKMTASLAAGEPVQLATVASVADGLLPVRPGDLTFAHVRQFVEAVVTVDDDAICRAVRWLFERAKLVVEPSGAASLAACLADQDGVERRTVAVVSGGNVALDVLAQVIGRAKA